MFSNLPTFWSLGDIFCYIATPLSSGCNHWGNVLHDHATLESPTTPWRPRPWMFGTQTCSQLWISHHSMFIYLVCSWFSTNNITSKSISSQFVTRLMIGISLRITRFVVLRTAGWHWWQQHWAGQAFPAGFVASSCEFLRSGFFYCSRN